MSANAIAAARRIASSEPSPIVGEMVLKLLVSILKGSAPEFIWSASFLALSLVKLPVMTALPFEIALLTVGADIIVLSIQIEIGVDEPASSDVAAANLLVPSLLSLRVTRKSVEMKTTSNGNVILNISPSQQAEILLTSRHRLWKQVQPFPMSQSAIQKQMRTRLFW